MKISKNLVPLILLGGLSLTSPAFPIEKTEKNGIERQIESKSYYITQLNDLDKAKKMSEIEYDAEIIKLAMKGLKFIYGSAAYFEANGTMWSEEMYFDGKEREMNIYFKDGKIGEITGIDKDEEEK